jgi:hypothetical protein
MPPLLLMVLQLQLVLHFQEFPSQVLQLLQPLELQLVLELLQNVP